MGAVLDVNTYQDVAGATTYFATRLASAKWISSSPSDKEASLVTASAMIDELHWRGSTVSAAQSMGFPRSEMYFDVAMGQSVPLSPTPLPIRVLCCELALHLITNPSVLESSGSVRTLDVGGVVLDVIREPPRIPAALLKRVKPMLKPPSGLMVWVGN